MLSLLSVAATSATSVAPDRSDTLESRPYLSAIGSPALRFADAIPPPDLTVRPPAGGPPSPAEAHSTSSADTEKPDISLAAPTPAAAVAISSSVPSTEPAKAAPVKIPPPILPDDTRPKVRAEDFLPFFQFPAPTANGDVTVVAPVPNAPTPAPLPPSSATYRQQ